MPKFGIPYSSQSPDIGQNSDGSILDFWISGHTIVKRNCHNPGTSDDTETITKKSLTHLSHYCFEKRYYFGQKTLIFCKENADIKKPTQIRFKGTITGIRELQC